MHIRFVHVDAFTAEPFTGNPAAVMVLTQPIVDAEWMQKVAREMNLSETAFLHRRPRASSPRAAACCGSSSRAIA